MAGGPGLAKADRIPIGEAVVSEDLVNTRWDAYRTGCVGINAGRDSIGDPVGGCHWLMGAVVGQG